MNELKPVTDSLVLYKIRPARVLTVGEKIEIELERGQTKRVRPKDIAVLHPGPLKRLADLHPQQGELEDAWELLQGVDTHLRELTELIYADYTPSAAWAAWQWVADGLYFSGSPDAICVRPPEAVAQDQAQREAKETARRDWEEFVLRLQQRAIVESDHKRLDEVLRVALGQSEQSRILEVLGHDASRENAHRLLVSLGYWSPEHNPYPARFGVNQEDPDFDIPQLPEEERRDLTHLAAFAIDDEGSHDPDDALSVDGDRLWVHVADVAALVRSDSLMDQEARARGSNLYAPERIVPMLPYGVTQVLGLGLNAVSPALSIGFRYLDGRFVDLEIVPSLVRVQRLTYPEVDQRLEQEPFAAMLAITGLFREHRHARDAAAIDLPEVNVRVVEGEVRIRPLPRLRSRNMVTDAMLMAGEATASFCLANGIPIPYASQPAPDRVLVPQSLSAMWSYRRQFKPSKLSLEPAPHFGLGLNLYTRATSPLRRYSDLLVHQQIRAHLCGDVPLDEQEVATRIDMAEMGSLAIRRAERLSNTHWKLVWLKRRSGWSGNGIVVENGARKAVVLIPELALDTRVRMSAEAALDAPVALKAREIDLPDLQCYFSASVA